MLGDPEWLAWLGRADEWYACPVRGWELGDHTAYIDANRYIKHATGLLLRTPGVPIPARRLCEHAQHHLDEVEDRPPPVDLPERIVHTRLTRDYVPRLTLAGLLRRGL